METGTVYVHYGDDTFRKLNPIINKRVFTKPYGGLWASRENDPDGWKSWCEAEEFRLDMFDQSFRFILKPGTKVLELSHENQLASLPKMMPYLGGFTSCYLDFETLAKEYDAIEVTDIGRLYFPLYGWDCNSILIMNPDVVEIL